MKLAIIFYHPKNPLNLADVASLAASQRAPLYVVKRPGLDPAGLLRERPPRLELHFHDTLEEVATALGSGWGYIVLETYGDRLLHETPLPAERVALVVGAEDYGIPREEAAKLPEPKVYARIPSAVYGMSYNVATTVAMALYEVKRRAATGGTP